MFLMFACKASTLLREESNFQFNGARVSLSNRTYAIFQPEHIIKLEYISKQEILHSSFLSQRIRGAYTSTMERPDLAMILRTRYKF